ncbi:MAG TPA: hypothetical protein VI231_18755 [Candidatus Binatia bacterium]|jgi:hypothetical protein
MKKSTYKNIVFGGLLAGSLIGFAAPVHAQSRGEIRYDQRVIDRDQEQLTRDRDIYDRHLRNGAGRRQLAEDEQRIRDDEARLRRDIAELRHDRRDFAENNWNGWYDYYRHD